MEESFWQKDSLITQILFELCLFRNLDQCTFFVHPLAGFFQILVYPGRHYIQIKGKILSNYTFIMLFSCSFLVFNVGFKHSISTILGQYVLSNLYEVVHLFS